MSKMVIHVIYHNFYTEDGLSESVGGIQTYLRNLLPIFVDMGYKVNMYQRGSVEFQNNYRGINVIGCKLKEKKYKKQVKELLGRVLLNADVDKDVLFFATTTDIVKNDFKKSLSIQHGITWDVGRHKEFSHNRNLFQIFLKAILAYKTIKDLDFVKEVICVDYNFVNWYRTQVAYADKEMVVIPNFVNIPEFFEKESDIVRIIFARRFQTYRGTRVFADVVDELIKEYRNIQIIFAGEGPDLLMLQNRYKDNSHIQFIKYKSEESITVHKNIDIAVVPTIGSEGTSLALLEAMAANCAVVCTDVGGLTNIVLNNYNGKMVSAGNRDQLLEAIKNLIDDPMKRKTLSKRGYETVKHSFSFEIWKKKWMDAIQMVI